MCINCGNGLGLYAPLLPNDLTEEIGIVGAVGYESLKTTEELKSPFLGWYFFTMYLTTDLFSPALPAKMITATTQKLAEDTAMITEFSRSFERATIRGSAANAWESAKDVCYDWGFDPRLIETKNICVWHAVDDTWCPPEIGAWLVSSQLSIDG